MAAAAASLPDLRNAIQAFDGCALKLTATNLVFADGASDADLLFVGEAPGRDEDLKGLPFVGRSGHLLDRMLAAIGRDRTSAYIRNVLPWRPPGNRTPTPEEMARCVPFLLRHIELSGAKIVVALGGVAAKQLLDTTTGIMRLRGTWQTLRLPEGRLVPVLPTFHPAYLLRQPAHKALAWRDFQEVRRRLAGPT
ncbi:MAG: uracil-DNA glycosylase family protein [Alphaproteobacteria bacterium]